MAGRIAAFLFALVTGLIAGSSARAAGPSDPFALDGSLSITEERHFGIVNGQLAARIPYGNVLTVGGLWAPPYVSSDFRLSVTVMDEPVVTKHYTWHPSSVERAGVARQIIVKSVATLIPGSRSGILKVTLDNTEVESRTVPLLITVSGTLDRAGRWEFGAPESTTAAKATAGDGTLRIEQGGLAVVVRGSGIEWNSQQHNGRMTILMQPQGHATLFLTFSIGPADEAEKTCASIASNPQKAVSSAQKAYDSRVRDLFRKLPRLESDDTALESFYNRSLVHFLMNRWDVPEFVLHPYYSTGSVNGGCVCNYLWNFGECWEILPLYDIEASRTHIKKFLSIDMMHHFSFEPLTGDAFGPWYPVNQEKIIGMIYYHVKNTGDTAFLGDTVGGKTVLEHAIANAMYGDDPAKPVALIDYGPSNSHLELRRGLPYNHVMPDLNGRRYENYLLAARLAALAGKPEPMLLKRAEELATVLKTRLWNADTRWFDFQDSTGKRDTRYTMQIFKLFNSRVLDTEEEAGLLVHLTNEKEFLSEFGLHSLSKTDPAYDKADVDNGGPGACTSFPPQIVERLYKAGHPEAAENILKRILWWGDRMPYWGDSIVAERVDYRKDTPLQCTLDGVAAAQSIIFGMFGVRAEFDGDIRIDPRPPAFARKVALKGLRLRGHVLDISINGPSYEVRDGGKKIRAEVGRPVIVRGKEMLMGESTGK